MFHHQEKGNQRDESLTVGEKSQFPTYCYNEQALNG